jgi:hypothetical protein
MKPHFDLAPFIFAGGCSFEQVDESVDGKDDSQVRKKVSRREAETAVILG